MAEDSDRLGIVSWIVLAALVVVPSAFGSGFTQYEFIKSTLFFALSGVALAWWGATVLRGRKITMTGGRLAAVISAFAAFALFAIAWAPSTSLGVVSTAHWVAATTCFLVVVAPAGRPLRFRHVALAVSVGTIVSAGLGLLDLAGLSLTTEIWDPPGAAGAFDAREFGVGYYAMALPVLAAGAFRGATKPKKAVAAVALLLGSMHFGLCAGPIMVAVIAGVIAATILIVGLMQGFGRLAFTFPTLGALAGGLAIAAALSFGGPKPGPANDATALPWVAELDPRPLLDRTDVRDARFSVPRIEEAPNWQARTYVMGIAFDLFRDEPIIGHGAGGWWARQTKFPRPEEPFVAALHQRYPAFRSPHNGLALVMTELGGVGLILLLTWLSAIAGITVTALAGKSEPEGWLIEHLGLSAAVLAGFTAALFTPSLEMAGPTLLLFVLAGLLVRESAALNEFKGLSAVWTINQTGRRWDTSLFCGVVPVALGVGLILTAVVWCTASYYRSWGDLAMLRTQHEVAVSKYSLADDILGGDGDLLYNLALAKKRLGRFKEARDDVNRAALLREYDVRVINLIAAIHLHDRQYADAVKASRRAVALFPNYMEGRRTVAAALNLQGRMSDAANELMELLKLNPDDRLKGQIHRELGEFYEGPLDNPAKAIEHFEIALGLMDRNFMFDRTQESLAEMKREVERRRLRREGKPLPPELMNQKVPDGHGPGDGHNH